MPTLELVRDCARCAALCCVAHSFSQSEDFAFDKAANERCRELVHDHRCRIHQRLVDEGMRGCALYDCYGAGQHITARAGTAHLDDVLEAFRVARTLHAWLSLLTTAQTLPMMSPPSLPVDIADAIAAVEAVATADIASIIAADLRPLRLMVDDILRRLRICPEVGCTSLVSDAAAR